MKLGVLLSLSIPLLGAQNPHAALLHVVAVHHSSSTDASRVTIEVTGEFVFRSGRMHNPERVYFDILNTTPHVGSRSVYSENVNDGLVQEIRVSEAAPGMTRVVLNIAEQVEAKWSQFINPSRLLVELRKVTAARVQPAAQRSPGSPVESSTILAPLVVAPTSARMAPTTHSGAEAVGEVARRGNSTLTRALGLKIRRIVIDPGHGGRDPGTQGTRGLIEKDLVLDIAHRVGTLVQALQGWEVVYTRAGDTYMSLESRTALANTQKADLFLSIHANSSPRLQSTGTESYYLNVTGSKDALAVAARENASAQQSISELPEIIKKMTRYDKAEESRDFAICIERGLADSNTGTVQIPDRGVKTAPFVVLMGADMPSVLAEVGFLSNPNEEALLKRDDFRQRIAAALYKGMANYANSLSHFPPPRP